MVPILLALWLVACLTIAFSLALRPAIASFTALALLVALPSGASQLLTGVSYNVPGGGLPAVHPATWLLLAMACALVLRSPGTVRPRSAGLSIAGLYGYCLVFAWAVFLTHERRGFAGLSQILEVFVAPALLMVILATAASAVPDFRRRLLSAVIWVGFLEAALAVYQYLTRSGWPYGTFANAFTVVATESWRSQGTLDHPLNLSLFLVLALGVVRLERRGPFALVMQVVILAGVFTTGSRAGFAFAAVALVAVHHHDTKIDARIIGPTLAAALVGVLAWSTGLAAGVLARFIGASGSDAVRASGRTAFSHIWSGYIIAGEGVGGSFDVSGALIHGPYSFESSPFMHWVDLGGVMATALYLSHLSQLRRRSGTWKRQRGYRVLGFIILLNTFTYSGTGTKSSAGYILSVALWLVATSQARPNAERSVEGCATTSACRTSAAAARGSTESCAAGVAQRDIRLPT